MGISLKKEKKMEWVTEYTQMTEKREETIFFFPYSGTK